MREAVTTAEKSSDSGAPRGAASKTRILLRLVAATVIAGATAQACAAGSQVGGAGAGASGTGGFGGGGIGGGVDMGTGSTTSGGTVHPGDALPANAVSFFNGDTCPQAWVTFNEGAGRLVLPSDAERIGFTSGKPLANGEDRKHTHTFTGQIDFPSVSFVGIPGGGNNGVGKAGTESFSGTTDPASTRLPYLQLLICKKVGQPLSDAPQIPSGMLMFFTAPLCPAGWSQSKLTRGRFVVGLPNNPQAATDASFGGPPLLSDPGDGGIDDDGGVDAGDIDGGSDGGLPAPMHTHPNSGALATDTHGIALAGGCCGGGYAGKGIYMFSADTDPADTGLPYIELLQCQKL